MKNQLDDEPFFRVHYVGNFPDEHGDGYWEKYDRKSKTWTRLCDQCEKRVSPLSKNLCTSHLNGKKRKRSKPKNEKDTNVDRVDNEILPLNIIISVSSALNKQQISHVENFVKLFNEKPNLIQWTCESQPTYVDSTTTHLITHDCGFFTTILTKEIIQACARHVFISSIAWITQSLEENSLLDHFPFEILRDQNSSKDTRGVKKCRFDQLPVFPSSYIFDVRCLNGVKQMKINREELIELVEISGANLYDERLHSENFIVICNSRKEMFQAKQQEKENEKRFYCRPEFLFDSIVRHEIQPFDVYRW